MKYRLISLTFLMLMMSAKVFAVQCNEKSEGFIAEGDAYYDVKPASELTKNEKKKILALFDFKNNRLRGSGASSECTLPESESKKISTRLNASARLNVLSNGEVNIELEVEKVGKKETGLERLVYFSENSHFDVLHISDSSVVVRTKYRNKNGAQGGAHLVEEITAITVSATGIDINLNRYINGFYTNDRSLRLKM